MWGSLRLLNRLMCSEPRYNREELIRTRAALMRLHCDIALPSIQCRPKTHGNYKSHSNAKGGERKLEDHGNTINHNSHALAHHGHRKGDVVPHGYPTPVPSKDTSTPCLPTNTTTPPEVSLEIRTHLEGAPRYDDGTAVSLAQQEIAQDEKQDGKSNLLKQDKVSSPVTQRMQKTLSAASAAGALWSGNHSGRATINDHVAAGTMSSHSPISTTNGNTQHGQDSSLGGRWTQWGARSKS